MKQEIGQTNAVFDETFSQFDSGTRTPSTNYGKVAQSWTIHYK